MLNNRREKFDDNMMMMTNFRCSKKTQPVRGWNVADICTHCVYTTPAPEMGARFRFVGKPAVAPCRLAGSAPQKTCPDNTHKQKLQSYGCVTSVTNNKQATNINRM